MGDVIPIKEKNTDNVVMFPLDKIVNPMNTALGSNNVPQNLQEIIEVTTVLKIQKIDQIMDITMSSISKVFIAFGISFNKDINQHVGFAIEALRSLLFKFFGMHHPLQDLAINIFQTDTDGKMMLKGLAVKMPTANTKE